MMWDGDVGGDLRDRGGGRMLERRTVTPPARWKEYAMPHHLASMLIRLPIFAFLFLPSLPTLAATIRVPSVAPTIQAGITIANPGDSVVVAPGTYFENLSMRSSITLIGEGTPEQTVIDGRLLGPVLSCENDVNFVLSKLTFARGFNAAYPGGAGIAMNFSSAIISDCILRDNVAGRDGGGISVVDSQAQIQRCQIRHNITQGQLDGGGVFTYRANVTLTDCLIVENQADEGGGFSVSEQSSVNIRNCVIHRNTATNIGQAGGALIMVNSSGQIVNNTMVGNFTLSSAHSVALVNSTPTFTRNIVALANGHGLNCGFALVTCNDVWGSGGSDYTGCTPHPSNFSSDPMFCNPGIFNFTLDENSPCAPDHSPAGCGLIGALDVGCGVTPVTESTWGQVKSRFLPAKQP
jgi:hypothetical protein